MSKPTRNVLLICGVVLGVLLLGLRVIGQLTSGSGDLGMLTGLLGYDQTKQYAVVLLDQQQESLLLLIKASKGKVELQEVHPASGILNDLPESEFSAAADTLGIRISSLTGVNNVDALGFVTIDAAGAVLDAFEGLYLHDQVVGSHNIKGIVSGLADSQEAVAMINNAAVVHKGNFITHSRAILFAVKDAFSRGLAAVYFKSTNPFGKDCIGACEAGLFEHSISDGSLIDNDR